MDSVVIENENMLIKTLPIYLKNAVLEFIEGYKNNSTLLDCLYGELQGSINSAFYDREITKKEFDFLRKKYLGL